MATPIIPGGYYEIARDIPPGEQPWFRKGEKVQVLYVADEVPGHPGAVFAVRSAVTGQNHSLRYDDFIAKELSGIPPKTATPPPLQAPAPGQPPPYTPPPVPSKKGMSTLAMVLIIIGGIIAALVVFGAVFGIPAFMSARNEAQTRTCKGNLRTIDGATMQYEADKGVFPESVEDLVQGSFLKKMPVCPSGDRPYEYDEHHQGSCMNNSEHTL